MGAVTYPNTKVIEFIGNTVIPVQLQSNAEPMATDYNVKWTPNILILDADGKEHHRSIGFLPPPEMVAFVLAGIGRMHFDLDRFKDAISTFEKVISDFPYTGWAPEAVYFRGVALYKMTHEAQPLKEAYEKLQAHYHWSEWAKRAQPYWLL